MWPNDRGLVDNDLAREQNGISKEVDVNFRNKLWRVPERLLLGVGCLLLTIYGSALLHREISSRIALRSFEQSQLTALLDAKSKAISQARREGDIDFSLWSEKRVQAYEESLLSSTDVPIALLAVSRLHIKVAVFNGTEDLTLNRGVGRIIGTAKPGEHGNIGIAGHRDGFFRGLKDAAVGDTIDLVTTHRTYTYAIESIRIVNPDDVSVLQPTSRPSLTLVTCYPFYFIGHAPQRYIVHASMASPHWLQQQASPPGSTVKKSKFTEEDKK